MGGSETVVQAPPGPDERGGIPPAADPVDPLKAFSTRIQGRIQDPRGTTLDPELRNYLESIDGVLRELGQVDPLKPATSQAIVERLEGIEPGRLDRAGAEDLLLELEPLLVDCAGPDTLYARAQAERRKTKRTTSWLTWDAVFGDDQPPGLTAYLAGSDPTDAEKTATRRRLLVLLKARREDELVHRTRQGVRQRILVVLALTLAGVVGTLLLVLALAGEEALPGLDLPAALVAMLAGALGATIAGTLKARDRLARSKDIASFQDGLPAQLLVGAGAALFVVLVLQAGIVTIGEIQSTDWRLQAVFGFLAGFSEPFWLKTVARVGTLGATPEGESATGAPTGS